MGCSSSTNHHRGSFQFTQMDASAFWNPFFQCGEMQGITLSMAVILVPSFAPDPWCGPNSHPPPLNRYDPSSRPAATKNSEASRTMGPVGQFKELCMGFGGS